MFSEASREDVCYEAEHGGGRVTAWMAVWELRLGEGGAGYALFDERDCVAAWCDRRLVVRECMGMQRTVCVKALAGSGAADDLESSSARRRCDVSNKVISYRLASKLISATGSSRAFTVVGPQTRCTICRHPFGVDGAPPQRAPFCETIAGKLGLTACQARAAESLRGQQRAFLAGSREEIWQLKDHIVFDSSADRTVIRDLGLTLWLVGIVRNSQTDPRKYLGTGLPQ